MSYVNILRAGTDHTIWAKGLEFYRDELDLMTRRLLEISSKNTSEEASKGVEHFQNQFIVQKEALQKLKHDLHKQLTNITGQVKSTAKITNMDTVDMEFVLRDKVHTAEKILLELKHSFYRFLSTVL